MGILSNVKDMAVSGLWKFGALALLATMVASDAYLGYQWHSAAADRDTAVAERGKAERDRDHALTQVGTLSEAIKVQNTAFKLLEDAKKAKDAQYEAALKQNAEYKKRVAAIPTQPKSTTCEQAVSRVRKTVDALRDAKE